MHRVWSIFSKGVRRDKKALVSFYLLVALSIVSLCLPLVANRAPLFMRYEGVNYYPSLVQYTEKDFGGVLDIPMDFHHSPVARQLEEKGWGVWPMIPYDAYQVDYSLSAPGPQGPSLRHWMGTDEHGRDLLVRLLYALRFSLVFGFLLAFLSVTIGFCVGALQGYMGGRVDMVLQRLVEIFYAIPILFVMIAVASLLGLTFWKLLGCMTFLMWRSSAPMMRVLFLRARSLPYVQAAYVLGQSHGRIIFKHILPNVIFFPLARLPFRVIAGVSLLTTLDFFGFSLPQTVLTFGHILVQGKNYPQAPWILLGALTFLSLLLMSLVFLGEALQKVFLFKGSEGRS